MKPQMSSWPAGAVSFVLFALLLSLTVGVASAATLGGPGSNASICPNGGTGCAMQTQNPPPAQPPAQEPSAQPPQPPSAAPGSQPGKEPAAKPAPAPAPQPSEQPSAPSPGEPAVQPAPEAGAPPAAQPPSPAGPEAAQPAAIRPAPDQPQTPEFARLRVYRQRRYVGSGLAPSIYVDEKQVARVGNGRRVTIRVAPGPHSIHSDDKSSSISLDVKAGQEYYVRVDEETGFWKGHGKLTLMMPEQGGPEFKLQKPVEEDRKFAREMIEEEPQAPPDKPDKN